jgi:hypothetical protein
MILSPIQALGDGYGFYLNKTRFPLKSVAGMTILEFCKSLKHFDLRPFYGW